jgi:hypothetical protein
MATFWATKGWKIAYAVIVAGAVMFAVAIFA